MARLTANVALGAVVRIGLLGLSLAPAILAIAVRFPLHSIAVSA